MFTLQPTQSTTLSDRQESLVNQVIEIALVKLQLRDNKRKICNHHYRDYVQVRSPKYILAFIKRRLHIENDQLVFYGEDRYEPVTWRLETDGDCKKIADYVANRCTSH